MENLSYDALVQMITEEVLKTVAKQHPGPVDTDGAPDKRPLALILGKGEGLPNFVTEKYRLASTEDYKGDISPFACVFIASLTCAQLADCATGRDTDKVSCAVTKAFLNGKKVYLWESALPHRAFANKASRALFKMMEGYANTLRSFGAEFVPKQWYGKNLDCNAIADNSVDKVITESIAITLCEKAQNGLVRLRRGTVITPSAKDIFNHSEITVEFV